MESRYRLQRGELEGEFKVRRKVGVLHNPAQRAAQRVVLSLEVPLAMGGRKKRPQRSFQKSLKQASAAWKQESWVFG